MTQLNSFYLIKTVIFVVFVLLHVNKLKFISTRSSSKILDNAKTRI